MVRMNIECREPKPLAAVCLAMVFQRPPSIVMLDAGLLGSPQGVQKPRPILCPPQHRRWPPSTFRAPQRMLPAIVFSPRRVLALPACLDDATRRRWATSNGTRSPTLLLSISFTGLSDWIVGSGTRQVPGGRPAV